MNKDLTLEEISKIINIHPLKIKGIYIFGSQIYETNNEKSDIDIQVVASNILEHVEFREKDLNIHVLTPDIFQNKINNYDIHCLECIFVPEHGKIYEKNKFEIKWNEKKLIQSVLNQSFSSWKTAKHKLNEGDIYRGLKSCWHSLRILYFGNQLKNTKSIINFKEANHLYKDIVESDEYDWDFFKNKYLKLKLDLENKLKN